MSQSIQIGWLNVPEHDHVDRGSECAAWSTTMHVPAQRVPLHMTLGSSTRWLCAGADATIIEDFFPSLYCGVLVGKPYDVLQNSGKPAKRRYQMYEYTIGHLVESGQVELLPEWSITRASIWGVNLYFRRSVCGQQYGHDYKASWFGPRSKWHVFTHVVPMRLLPAPEAV